ncbi:unnamed protein product [Rhizophagus irregularis]|nr:unnamed protein product [Rhizophagus irregularis]
MEKIGLNVMHGKTHTGFGTTAQLSEMLEYESDDVGNIFENVKVDKVDDKLISCTMWKAPEDEFDESERVSVNEIYYQYCDECYTTVSNKKKQISSSKRLRK